MEWPRCALPYAPPEVVMAVHDKCRAAVSAAQDIWSLGAHFGDAAKADAPACLHAPSLYFSCIRGTNFSHVITAAASVTYDTNAPAVRDCAPPTAEPS